MSVRSSTIAAPQPTRRMSCGGKWYARVREGCVTGPGRIRAIVMGKGKTLRRAVSRSPNVSTRAIRDCDDAKPVTGLAERVRTFTGGTQPVQPARTVHEYAASAVMAGFFSLMKREKAEAAVVANCWRNAFQGDSHTLRNDSTMPNRTERRGIYARDLLLEGSHTRLGRLVSQAVQALHKEMT